MARARRAGSSWAPAGNQTKFQLREQGTARARDGGMEPHSCRPLLPLSPLPQNPHY